MRNHVNTLGPLHGMQAGFREPRAPDLTPDSSPGRPCARAPQLIACSLFDTWTRLDQPQPISPPRHQMVNQMEPPSPASNARPITRVQNPAIALARWIESSMSVRRARARLASEAEPAWPMGSYSQVSGALIFRFQIRDRDFLSFFICLCSELQP